MFHVVTPFDAFRHAFVSSPECAPDCDARPVPPVPVQVGKQPAEFGNAGRIRSVFGFVVASRAKVVIAHSFARFKRHESRVVTGAGQPPGGRSRGDGARPSQDHEYEEGEARNVRGEAPRGAAIRAIITPDLRTASRVHRRGNGRFKMPTNTAGCRLSSAWRSRGRDRTWRETRVGCTARAGM